ncbi:MAG: 6-bladed beta-propeller [Bacteroidales bacterium]|nr:6-bladed beta-propeller [Bacteroidales bacterium]
MKHFLICIIACSFLIVSCSNKGDNALSFVKIDGNKVPVLSLDNIEDEPITLGLSEIVSDYKLIPLETKEECLIEYAHPYYSEGLLLISTQHFPGPAPLYMFDLEGKFIREIGKGGKGPGEHSGYVVENVIIDRDFGEILANFQNVIQRFDLEGNFIDKLNQPDYFRSDAYRLDKNTWFVVGSSADYVSQVKDSSLVNFYNEAGDITGKIRRYEFPPKTRSGFTPGGFQTSVYKHAGVWKLSIQGLDTLYRLEDKSLVPELIIEPGSKAMRHNEIITQSEFLGSVDFAVFAENKNYYFIRKGAVSEAELVEFREGSWGGMINYDYELLLLDKNSFRVTKLIIEDDIYGVCEPMYFSAMAELFDSKHILYPLHPEEISSKAEGILNNDNLSEETRSRFSELKKLITLESNPAILFLTLKDNIDLN